MVKVAYMMPFHAKIGNTMSILRMKIVCAEKNGWLKARVACGGDDGATHQVTGGQPDAEPVICSMNGRGVQHDGQSVYDTGQNVSKPSVTTVVRSEAALGSTRRNRLLTPRKCNRPCTVISTRTTSYQPTKWTLYAAVITDNGIPFEGRVDRKLIGRSSSWRTVSKTKAEWGAFKFGKRKYEFRGR